MNDNITVVATTTLVVVADREGWESEVVNDAPAAAGLIRAQNNAIAEREFSCCL
jgi:hypothetical protein